MRKIRQYRTYPYVFKHSGDTIEAVLRLYNDMNIAPDVIEVLRELFNEVNPDATPPKLGQQVQIPVLLTFCYRHENNNKIFTNE